LEQQGDNGVAGTRGASAVTELPKQCDRRFARVLEEF